MKIITKLQAILNTPEFKPVWEAFKEGMRLFLFALFPALISYLESAGTAIDPIVVAIGVLILRSVDKAIHEYGKKVESETLIKGLSRF